MQLCCFTWGLSDWLLAFLLTEIAIVLATPAQFHDRQTQNTRPLSSELLALINSTQSITGSSPLVQAINAQAAQIDGLVTLNRRDGPAGLACLISHLVFRTSKYVDASSPSYTGEIDENWSNNCWLPAACIVRVQYTVDVAVLLKILTVTGSKFAIRSGGQDPNPGHGSIDGLGVLIDMASVNTIQLSRDRKSVAVGPGIRAGKVYEYLDPYRISIIGPRSPVPALGGFLTGGGLPYIPSLYGMAVDNVKNFEVVLGNSTVVNANAAENSDLFFALKGGGPNYGVVTRYDLYTVSLHDIWYKFNTYNQSDYKTILAATVKCQAALESDPKASFIWVADNSTILIGLIYGQWTSKPAVFDALESLTPTGSFIAETNGTVYSLSQALNFLYSSTSTRYIGGVSLKVDLDVYTQAFTRYLSISSFTNNTGADQSFTIQPISGKYNVAAAELTAEILSVPQPSNKLHRITGFNTVAEVENAADKPAAFNAKTVLTTTVQQVAEAKGLFLPYIFQNDASYTQNTLASYGASNLAKLRAASQKYDNQQVFQTNQYGGFKVSNA